MKMIFVDVVVRPWALKLFAPVRWVHGWNKRRSGCSNGPLTRNSFLRKAEITRTLETTRAPVVSTTLIPI